MDSEQTLPDEVFKPATDSGDLSIKPIPSEIIINASKVNKYFGEKHVLKDVDFEVHKREVVALIGPSGSGKSTLYAASMDWKSIPAERFTSTDKSLIPVSQINNWLLYVANWAWSSRILISFHI